LKDSHLGMLQLLGLYIMCM